MEKRIILFWLFLVLLISILHVVNAETTFFDQDNAFIMGSSTTEGTTGESTLEGEATGEGCLTNWTCSDWDSCNNGVQIRNCTKTKTYCYADLNKKPIESQNCSVDKSEEGITSSPNEKRGNSVKAIILGMFIVIVIVVIVLFVYRRHRKRRYFRHRY